MTVTFEIDFAGYFVTRPSIMALGDKASHMDTGILELLINRYISAYNAFDIDGMLGVLSQDIRFENFSGGKLTHATTGIEEFRRLAEHSVTLFSERAQKITSIQVGARIATVTIAYRGVLAADMPDGPRAGSVIELQGTSEFSFTGGRIVKIVDRA